MIVGFQRAHADEEIKMDNDILHLHSRNSLEKNRQVSTKLEALNRLHLSILCTVEIHLSSANIGMFHEGLNGSKVVTIIQEGSGEGVMALVSKN